MKQRIFVLLVLALLAGCGKAPSHTGAAPRTEHATAGPRRTMLEVRVDLAVDVGSGDEASRLSRALEARVNGAGGFVESSSIGEGGAHVVLRVPPAEIEGVRGVLAANGPIANESRSARDVTDAVMDLDARVKAAKIEESRLLELLQNKTGNLADVLAVEKSLADVRERIERMETEQRAAHGRVDLAVVDVSLRLRGALDGAPVGQRFVVAGREGVVAAREALILIGTTTLRVGPTLLILCGLLAGAFTVVRRVRQRAE